METSNSIGPESNNTPITIECANPLCTTPQVTCKTCKKFTMCPRHYKGLSCPKCIRPRRPRLAQQVTQSMHATELLLWEKSNHPWLESLGRKLRDRRREQNKQTIREKRAAQDKTHPSIPRSPKRIRSKGHDETSASKIPRPKHMVDPTTRPRMCVLLPGSPSTRWYAPCSTPQCPCTASFNGQEGETCGKRCRTHKPCEHNVHSYPREAPKTGDKRQPLPLKHVARLTKEEHRRARLTPTYYRSSHTGSSAHPRG